MMKIKFGLLAAVPSAVELETQSDTERVPRAHPTGNSDERYLSDEIVQTKDKKRERRLRNVTLT